MYGVYVLPLILALPSVLLSVHDLQLCKQLRGVATLWKWGTGAIAPQTPYFLRQ